jgi:hypothetical protein
MNAPEPSPRCKPEGAPIYEVHVAPSTAAPGTPDELTQVFANGAWLRRETPGEMSTGCLPEDVARKVTSAIARVPWQRTTRTETCVFDVRRVSYSIKNRVPVNIQTCFMDANAAPDETTIDTRHVDALDNNSRDQLAAITWLLSPAQEGPDARKWELAGPGVYLERDWLDPAGEFDRR